MRKPMVLRLVVGEVIDPEQHLPGICWVRIDLDHLVDQVARIADAVQRRLEVLQLTCPPRACGQVETNKTCMQWLADVAWRLAGASMSRSKIIGVSGYKRPVVINDGLHQPMVFPAVHSSPRDMCAFDMSSCHGLVDQSNGQAFVDKELHNCLPLFNPRSSTRLFLLTPGVEAWTRREAARFSGVS